MEVCQSLATSSRRREILTGFLELRRKLRDAGVTGFQWLGGSFMEEIEVFENRDPGDIDVVTWAATPGTPAEVKTALDGAGIFDNDSVKATHKVDHYVVSLFQQPAAVVDRSRYWCGLFSHRRDQLWKGMLQVDLDATGDDDACQVLNKGVYP
jgi:hypothetical protein